MDSQDLSWRGWEWGVYYQTIAVHMMCFLVATQSNSLPLGIKLQQI